MVSFLDRTSLEGILETRSEKSLCKDFFFKVNSISNGKKLRRLV